MTTFGLQLRPPPLSWRWALIGVFLVLTAIALPLVAIVSISDSSP